MYRFTYKRIQLEICECQGTVNVRDQGLFFIYFITASSYSFFLLSFPCIAVCNQQIASISVYPIQRVLQKHLDVNEEQIGIKIQRKS